MSFEINYMPLLESITFSHNYVERNISGLLLRFLKTLHFSQCFKQTFGCLQRNVQTQLFMDIQDTLYIFNLSGLESVWCKHNDKKKGLTQ